MLPLCPLLFICNNVLSLRPHIRILIAELLQSVDGILLLAE